jgi:hypothetical protein
MVELSIPVIWVEDGGAPVAGRLDVTSSGLHLDGGSRMMRRIRDLDFGDIASVRIGRRNGERIAGRSAVVLQLIGGTSLSFSGFDRPGAVHELAERLERALSAA